MVAFRIKKKIISVKNFPLFLGMLCNYHRQKLVSFRTWMINKEIVAFCQFLQENQLILAYSFHNVVHSVTGEKTLFLQIDFRYAQNGDCLFHVVSKKRPPEPGEKFWYYIGETIRPEPYLVFRKGRRFLSAQQLRDLPPVLQKDWHFFCVLQ